VARGSAAAAPTVVRLPVVDSTQRVAFELAERGAPDGTAVVADTQTAGRGRRGRRWHDTPGESLLASIVVRPELPPAQLPQLSLTAAVAVAEAIADLTGLAPRLKWPNDVVIRGRKLAGILLESRSVTTTVVVIGVGINLAQMSFALELAESATSVRLEDGRVPTPAGMLDAILVSLDAWRGRLAGGGFAPVRARWMSLAETIGRAVHADGRTGVAVDLDEQGALIVREGAELHRVVAGEVGDAMDD
jgi:BirA family biotin operon repressor/biotin-[acetyl-CoA-carboxylase] ligase